MADFLSTSLADVFRLTSNNKNDYKIEIKNNTLLGTWNNVFNDLSSNFIANFYQASSATQWNICWAL